VGNLFEYAVAKASNHDFLLECDPSVQRLAEYSIVTLNYDCLLEKAAEYWTQNFRGASSAKFVREEGQKPNHAEKVLIPLLKLHGCTTEDFITAPTWNKGIGEGSPGTMEFCSFSAQDREPNTHPGVFVTGGRCVFQIPAQIRRCVE
jgi:hypothetical protein